MAKVENEETLTLGMTEDELIEEAQICLDQAVQPPETKRFDPAVERYLLFSIAQTSLATAELSREILAELRQLPRFRE